MTDREKVIKGLEKAIQNFERYSGDEYGREYDYARVGVDVLEDAIALLKAQEPRVMTWKEAQASVNSGPFIIMEVRDSTGTEVDYGVLVKDSYEMSEGSLLTVCDFWMLEEEYGKRFRCWTSRPTDGQREAIPWNL